MIGIEGNTYIIDRMTQLEVLRWKGIEARGVNNNDNNYYALNDIITACNPTGTDRDIWVDEDGDYFSLDFKCYIDPNIYNGRRFVVRTSPDLPIIAGYDPEIIKELAKRIQEQNKCQ